MGHHADGHLHHAERAKVERLMLYAPSWIRQTASLVQAGPGPLPVLPDGQSRTVQERWYTGVPEDKKAGLIPAGWFDAWADATFATDSVGAQMNPAVVRAPNGVVQDGTEFFGAGKTLLRSLKDHGADIAGRRRMGRDTPPYMAQTLFPLLVNSPGKRSVGTGRGNPQHHHGAQSPEAVRSRAGVSR